MIILITGATHTGKTLLAQKIIERRSYSCLSVDLLKMGLIRSGNTHLTPEDDDRLEALLWPIVREMMKTAIENEQHLVVEGGYVPRNWKDDLADDYLKEIRAFCLVMSRKYIENHFADIRQYACAMEQRRDDSWSTAGAQRIFCLRKMRATTPCATTMSFSAFLLMRLTIWNSCKRLSALIRAFQL